MHGEILAVFNIVPDVPLEAEQRDAMYLRTDQNGRRRPLTALWD